MNTYTYMYAALSTSLLLSAVCCSANQAAQGEHKHHNPINAEHADHDGKHNADYDHEAILGSKKDEEDFDNLSPEVAKGRLAKLVGKMDTNSDGFVDRDELIEWILHSFRSLDEEEAATRLKENDDNEDSSVSWAEYMKHVYDYEEEQLEQLETDNSPESEQIKQSIQLDKKKFRAADLDHNDLLNTAEYAAFLHPYDYDHMTDVEVDSTLAEQDKNTDGKISFEEFTGTDGESLNQEQMIIEKEQFNEYDSNKDGELSREEIKKWVAPDNTETARKEADHLFDETDTNKDSKLQKEEIVDQHELWVGSQATDYGEHLKDEL